MEREAQGLGRDYNNGGYSVLWNICEGSSSALLGCSTTDDRPGDDKLLVGRLDDGVSDGIRVEAVKEVLVQGTIHCHPFLDTG